MPRSLRFLTLLLVSALLLACAPQAIPPAPTAPLTTAIPPGTPPATPTALTATVPSSPTPGSTRPIELTVFAAASLTESFSEIGKDFEKANPGTKVTFSFAGSQDLAAQIAEGAPADVFASANATQMNVVVKSGRVAPDAPRTFARNRLVVIIPASNPAKIASLVDLARPGLKLILENKSVPAGQYSLDFLDKASKDPTYGSSYRENVLKNVVSYEQDVKAVVTKISLGEGDAGIVYSTDVTPAVSEKLGQIAIPDQLNSVAAYPIAVVRDSKHRELAQKFVDAVLGPEGQAVLTRWGFIPPPPSTPSSSTAVGSVALTGLVNTPSQLTAAALQQLPAELVNVTFQGPNGPESHRFRGARLATVISQAGLKLDPKRKNDQIRKYLVFTGKDGYEAILGWGEIDPALGNTPILLAWEQDDQPLDGTTGPLRLVVPADKFGGRNVFGLVKIEVRDVDSGPRQEATSLVPARVTPTPGSVTLEGLVAQPASITPHDLGKFPSQSVEVSFQGPKGLEKHTFTGVPLHAVIEAAKIQVNASHRNDLLCKYIVVTASDGYEALISYGEIAPNFGNKPILLAWEQDGAPLAGSNGPLRLVVPGDGHGARYVSGVMRMEVRDVESPPRSN